MDPRLFNRITGTIYVIAGHKSSTVPEGVKKHNIGLQLKMIKAVCKIIHNYPLQFTNQNYF